MDEALRQALERGGEVARNALLRSAAEQRRHVGLGDESALSALQLAALYDDEAAAVLLAHGCACDLHSACALGHTLEIRQLGKPEAFAVLAEHLTPMGFALARSRLASTRALLELGDDPNRAIGRIGFFAWEMDALAAGHGHWTPLHAACAHGYAADARAIVEGLIAAGARFDVPCPLGTLPLHLTAAYGWVQPMETLLAAGADVDSRTLPVPAALWRMTSPANTEPAHELTPLMIAAREGKTAAVRRLLRGGAAVDARDSLGRSPLHAAAAPWWGESVELTKLLFDAGANWGGKDAAGRTPLDHAVAIGHAQTAAFLTGAANRRGQEP